MQTGDEEVMMSSERLQESQAFLIKIPMCDLRYKEVSPLIPRLISICLDEQKINGKKKSAISHMVVCEPVTWPFASIMGGGETREERERENQKGEELCKSYERSRYQRGKRERESFDWR